MKFLSVPVFIISLAIGLFIVYLTAPKQKIIFVYPTPDNFNRFQYKDKAENCFTFEPYEVNCPSNKKDVKEIPIQK